MGSFGKKLIDGLSRLFKKNETVWVTRFTIGDDGELIRTRKKKHMNQPEIDLTEDEYNVLNARRHELIEKKYSCFTDEERSRPYTVPGWREESDRRDRTALTDAERAELDVLQAKTGAYLNKRYPLPEVPDLADLERQLREKHGG